MPTGPTSEDDDPALYERWLVDRAIEEALRIDTHEKAASARARLDRLVRRRLGSRSAPLNRCTEERRCGEALCPKCTRRKQFELITEYTSTFRKKGSAPRWMAAASLTLVPESGRIAAGELVDFDLVKERERIRRKLYGTTESARMLGAVDVTCNSHAEDKFAPHWQVHYHAISTEPDELDPEAIREFLGERGPTRGSTLRIEPAYFPPGLIAYLSKLSVKQRISSVETKRPVNRRLSPEHEAELITFLWKYSVDQRFFRVRL